MIGRTNAAAGMSGVEEVEVTLLPNAGTVDVYYADGQTATLSYYQKIKVPKNSMIVLQVGSGTVNCDATKATTVYRTAANSSGVTIMLVKDSCSISVQYDIGG